jgi:hypothetical protein
MRGSEDRYEGGGSGDEKRGWERRVETERVRVGGGVETEKMGGSEDRDEGGGGVETERAEEGGGGDGMVKEGKQHALGEQGTRRTWRFLSILS